HVDNCESPRRNLERAFFRVYENDKPAKTPHFFRWSETGPKENAPVFVTGHPGTTQRLETLAKLKHRRDYTLPYTLYRLRTMEAALTQYSEQSPERKRQAATDLHSAANSRKAFAGQLQGLLDPKIMQQKFEAENDPKMHKLWGEAFTPPQGLNPPPQSPWTRIELIQKAYREF